MSLLNKLISDTYQSLLKVVSDTGLVAGVKQRVMDGKGTNTALEIGTDGINVEGDFETGGTRRMTSTGVLTNVSGNISQFTNDSNYLQSIPSDVVRVGDPITDLNNNAGFLTDVPADVMREGENISLLNNDSGFITSGDTTDFAKVSDLPTSGDTSRWDEGYDNSVSNMTYSSGFLTLQRPSGGLGVFLPVPKSNLSELNDDINNIVSGDPISSLNNDIGYLTSGDTSNFLTNQDITSGDTSNWDAAYDRSLTGMTVSGSNLILQKQDGSTLSATLPSSSGGTTSGGTTTDTLDEVFRIPYDVNFNLESSVYTFFRDTIVFYPIKLKKGRAASAIIPIKTAGNNNIIVGLYDKRPPQAGDSTLTYEYLYGVPNNLIVNFGSFNASLNDTIYRLDLTNPVDIEDGVYFVGVGQNGQWISTGPQINTTSLKIKDNNYIDSDFIYQQDTYASNKTNLCRVTSSTLPSTISNVNDTTSNGLLSYIKII